MMKLQELQEKLKNGNIRQDAYNIGDGLPNEAYCLNQVDGKWEVYYSERGEKTGLKIFEDEENACNYFYLLLRNENS